MRCRYWIVGTLAALTLCMNAPALARLARSGSRLATSWQSGYRGTSEAVDAARRMAALAKANGRSIAYCRSRADGLLPIERSRILAMSWENAPRPIRSGSLGETIGADAIVVAEHEPSIELALKSLGYRIRDSGGGVNLWCRDDDWKASPVQGRRGYANEILSLSVLVAFLACCHLARGHMGFVVGMTGLSAVMFAVVGAIGLVSSAASLSAAVLVAGGILLWGRNASCHDGRHAPTTSFVTVGGVFVMVAVGAIYAALSLTHTFVAPNGLGVVGGRARLMFLAGGIPDDFFTDPAFAPFQPAYPPGAASLVLWCYSLSGFCGEWMIQLLPCALMAAIAGCIASRLRTAPGALLAFVVFTTPVSIRLATLFYPEVYVAICCLAGWERIRKDKLDYAGWLLLGMSGWFKNEGLVYFCSMAMAVLVVPPHAGFRRLALRVAVGAALPIAWHLGCRQAGASLDGYLPIDQLRLHQFVAAACKAYQYMFCTAWQYAFMFPLALVLMLMPRWRDRNLTTMVIGMSFAAVGFAVIFSLSAVPDFEWHLDSMERLLWVPSLFILRECECFFRESPPRLNAKVQM